MTDIERHSASQSELILSVFDTLEQHYGYFDWWQRNDPYEIVLGAILVQNTNWKNAEKALANLGEQCNPISIADMELDELAQKIRSSGYYNQKAIKLKAVTHWFLKYQYDISVVREQDKDQLRKELLEVKGIGGETADAILVYAIGKPSFVIDAYARRILTRNGLDVPKSYEKFRALMESVIPLDTKRYGYYHGLLVEHGQQFCHPKPKCQQCPLTQDCIKNGVEALA
ncbi:Endonuclease [Vibrio chagasii]|uniref:endonuclease III domain-containing protein n=1 Tax=Vibrio chagasii TaxID=170679 RepID=UPI001EFE852F|nr:endonuclease [Vibrio chagasii]MDE9380678.1 endonuclease [Vibrio alginolyticus]MCG9607207.1 endonuclease [Vibrio chagasii]CAH7054010.1 Endonuclease [Vibrio chagasii]CAH7070122.1 Endonuclease [Vibrio chagasii]CAH7076537.1 Endonuclease [Vibrio chagasii]